MAAMIRAASVDDARVGPLLDAGAQAALFAQTETVEEARALTETDPAIQSGSLVMELYPWYSSAALMKVNDIHTQITENDSI